MADLAGTSWQQRYNAAEIFTLRFRILDKPGTFAKLSQVIGETDAQLGNINFIGVEGEYKIRDISIYLENKDQLDEVLANIKTVKNVEVVKVTDEILEMHRRGSIEMVSRVPIKSLTDLRMLYTPGVASVCQEIEKNPDMAYEMTGLCDRVAIVTNGTAVLGLGDIGTVPSLPVMEGKAAIFAEFVKISGVPILIDTKDVDVFVETLVRIASSFGAIQLEDVSAPACFEIEEKLRERLNIPVFHDDQHGTATVVQAALINALKLTGKKPQDSTVIILGSGAAGIAISKILIEFGIKDIIVYDSTGPIYRGRTEKMNPYKQQLAEITNKDNFKGTLLEGFAGRDIFIGVSRPNMVSQKMVASMAKDAIVFPLSNPVGEITKEDAYAAGAAIAADGRDINNALAYPGIFRGALDARATEINLAMQLASARTLAQLAPEGELLPDILDKEVHRKAAQAVTQAAKK